MKIIIIYENGTHYPVAVPEDADETRLFEYVEKGQENGN